MNVIYTCLKENDQFSFKLFLNMFVILGHVCKFYATKIKKKNEGLLTQINLLFENVRNLEKKYTEIQI